MHVPCYHIFQYYQWRWENHRCIAFNLLRRGYYQWAGGRSVESGNNLYEVNE